MRSPWHNVCWKHLYSRAIFSSNEVPYHSWPRLNAYLEWHHANLPQCYTQCTWYRTWVHALASSRTRAQQRHHAHRLDMLVNEITRGNDCSSHNTCSGNAKQHSGTKTNIANGDAATYQGGCIEPQWSTRAGILPVRQCCLCSDPQLTNMYSGFWAVKLNSALSSDLLYLRCNLLPGDARTGCDNWNYS